MWKKISTGSSSNHTQDGGGGQDGTSGSDSSSRPHLPKPSTTAPSLVGLLASKRLARRLTTKISSRRDGFGSSSVAGMILEKEPTYRMDPKKRFDSCAVERVIKSVLEDRLDGFMYNPKFCSNMIKILSDEIKEKVKTLGFERYKIVCVVVLSQKRDQSMLYCSRSSWDEKRDNFSTYTFQNNNIVCVASVYGLFNE